MADPFLAEIRPFAFNFPPTGWAFCDGQLLPISQNTALFSLVGTFYGGDGKSTFGLPDLQGLIPIGVGQGNGLSDYVTGEIGGSDTVTLLQSEMPFHPHTVQGVVTPGDQPLPGGNFPATTVGDTPYASAGMVGTFAPEAVPPAGKSLPHNNLMPYVVLNFCIAMQGIYPARG